MAHALDRRDLLKGGAAAAALVGAGVIAPQHARAAEADTGQTWGVFDEEGMFTPSFLIAPDPIPASDIVDVTETDVVVVGMGLAGMSAARAAIEEGAQVVVVEKGNEHHTHSHQFHAINCQAAKDMGAELTQEQIDLLVDSEIVGNFHERVDRRLWEYLLNHCGEDFDWYLSLTDHYTVVNPNETVAETELDAEALMNICTAGLGFIVGRGFPEVGAEREQAVRDAGPYICVFNHPLNPNFDLAAERFPMSPGVVTVEPDHSVLGNNVAAFIEANADVRYASWCRRILREEQGRVTGIVYEDIDGKFHQVNAAKGVVLCSGDFAGNKAMVNYFQDCHRLIQGGDLGWVDVDAKGERTNLGEGLSMAHWIGAKVDNTHACCNDHYGGALGCDPMLFVDGKGERFMNEDVTGEILGEKVNRVAGQVIWQVFDSNYPDQISHMPVGHRCYWKVAESYDEIPMGLFLDPIGMITRSEVEGWPGLVAPADTLEELAENMGVPADAFVATVERYNELHDKGVDEDFGKRADRLTEVRTPPFYAAQMRPLGYQTFYGSVCCDEATHAVDEQNNAIPGLYVAGTVMGSRFWNVYPNTAMGVNHAGALSYGRLAGTNAARGA